MGVAPIRQSLGIQNIYLFSVCDDHSCSLGLLMDACSDDIGKQLARDTGVCIFLGGSQHAELNVS